MQEKIEIVLHTMWCRTMWLKGVSNEHEVQKDKKGDFSTFLIPPNFNISPNRQP